MAINNRMQHEPFGMWSVMRVLVLGEKVGIDLVKVSGAEFLRSPLVGRGYGGELGIEDYHPVGAPCLVSKDDVGLHTRQDFPHPLREQIRRPFQSGPMFDTPAGRR